MDKLDELRQLLGELVLEETQGENFHESAERLQAYRKRFKILIDDWIQECQKGKEIPLKEIRLLVKHAFLKKETKLERRPNPKIPNSYDTILGFYEMLYVLSFEMDKMKSAENVPDCHCQLRLVNNLQPDFQFLYKYGRAILYYEEDDFTIFICKLCSINWINATIPGMNIAGNTWRKWDPNEYLLREVFMDERS